MRKRNLVIAGIIGAAGAYCYYRDRKYPLAKGNSVYNKFVIPGGMFTPAAAAFANSILSKEKPYNPPGRLVMERRQIPTGSGSRIAITFYRPQTADGNLPCLIYFHGGGFILKDQAYIHKIVCRYADYAQCCVAFVQYRTADQAPFPTPFQDCCQAIQYVWNHTKSLKVDVNRIALGGDSAGGALAAACAQWCRNETKMAICFQMLIYPVTDLRMNSESMKRYTDAPLWNARLNKKMWQIYLRDGICEKAEYASPALAEDFVNLPPAYIEISEFDSLRDEGAAYADSLRAAGVCAVLKEIKGGFHGFDFNYSTELTQDAIYERSQALRRAFAAKTQE